MKPVIFEMELSYGVITDQVILGITGETLTEKILFGICTTESLPQFVYFCRFED